MAALTPEPGSASDSHGHPRLDPRSARGIGRLVPSALVGGATVGIGALVVLDGIAPVSGFTASHYLVTYQDGFRRRALVGSVVAALMGDAPVPAELPAVMGLGFLGLLLVTTGVLVGIAWARGDRRTVLLLAALLVGSSELRVLAFDVGKFDALLLALTVGSAVAALGPARVAQVVVAVLGVAGVLVHELHLVVGVPLATAMVALHHGRSARSRLAIAVRVGGPAGLLGAAIALLAGSLPGGSVASAERRMAARAAFPLEDSVAPFLDLSLLETIRVTLDVVSGAPGPVLTTVLVALPAAAAAFLLRGARRAEGPGLFVAAALAPLLMLPVAFDWYRWLTIAVVNLIVVGLWRQAGATALEGPPAARSGVTSSDAGGPGIGAVALVLVSILLATVSVTDALANLRGLVP